jgi:hypothetical protein
MSSRAVSSHPLFGSWICGECETETPAGYICPDCYTVLCAVCAAAGEHQEPTGARAGMSCGSLVDTAA